MNKKKLIEKLTNNWAPKVICFSLAIFIYIFHQVALLDKKSFSIPLEVISEGVLVPSSDIPHYVKIVVRAKSDNIARISSTGMKAYIYLNDYTDIGTYDIPVSVKLSSEMMLMDPLEVSVKPELISVSLDEKVQKYVPVKPLTSGVVEHGFKISSIDVVPSTIKVIGPSKIINSVNYIYTEKVNVKGAAIGFTSEVGIDNQVSIIEPILESKFKVTVVVDPEIINKNYEKIKINSLNLNPRYMILTEFPLVDFEIEGTVALIESLNPNDISAYIDFSSIKSVGIFDVPIIYSVPYNITVVNKSLDSLSVEIVKIKDNLDNIEKDEVDVSESEKNENIDLNIDEQDGVENLQ